MITLAPRMRCNGCGACAATCTVGAVSMKKDEDGFLYPCVDVNECVSCGKCGLACPIVEPERDRPANGAIAAYAAQTKNKAILRSSSSGGLFSEIAGWIIDRGGVVFGAAFDDALRVKHICVEHAKDLERLRGSKYVQSELGDSYREAKRYLDKGRMVLFTGTPCQIGGLYGFLDKDYPGLYTQDIICHGVPSPMVWQRYIEFREGLDGAKACRVAFRHKKYGWKKCCIQIEYANSTQYTRSLSDDMYMRCFLDNMCLRPSCHNCAFKTKNRYSDLTLADFWGIEHLCPEMDDDGGTSLVILHSAKGRALFEAIKENLKQQEVEFEEAIKYNSSMTASVAPHSKRNVFVRTVRERGFCCAKPYVRTPLVRKVKQLIKKILNRS